MIFLEYAIDTAEACKERGVNTVAVTAGYVTDAPREAFFRHIDAANVDLKAFTDRFYWKICGGRLQPVLDTIQYLRHETDVWVELTTLLIPGENDSEREIDAMTAWIYEHLGPDVPLHFTAFHPDWKMLDKPRTPLKTLRRAREVALGNGLHYVYTGNVHDFETSSTYCCNCGALLIGRDWYELSTWHVAVEDRAGTCASCGAAVAGVFADEPGSWSTRRVPIRLN